MQQLRPNFIERRFVMFPGVETKNEIKIEIKTEINSESWHPPIDSFRKFPTLMSIVLDQHIMEANEGAGKDPGLFEIIKSKLGNHLFDLLEQIDKAHNQKTDLYDKDQNLSSSNEAVAKNLDDKIKKILSDVKKMLLDNPALISTFKQRLATYLCKLVLFGKPHQLKQLLDLNSQLPPLIFEQGNANDRANRQIEGSPFKCFLGAGDYFKDMINVMKQFIDKVEGGRKTAIQQLIEQFPYLSMEFKEPFPSNPYSVLKKEAIEAKEAEEKCFEVFKNVAMAIRTEQFIGDQISQNTKDELEKLMTKIRRTGIIKEGEHFDEKLLIAAHQIFFYYMCSHDKKFPSPSWHTVPRYTSNEVRKKQNSLFWCKVIGSMERLFTENLIQIHFAPLRWWSIMNRSQIKLANHYNSFTKITEKPDSGLGFDFAIWSDKNVEYIVDFSILSNRMILGLIEQHNRKLWSFIDFKAWLMFPQPEPVQQNNHCLVM